METFEQAFGALMAAEQAKIVTEHKDAIEYAHPVRTYLCDRRGTGFLQTAQATNFQSQGRIIDPEHIQPLVLQV